MTNKTLAALLMIVAFLANIGVVSAQQSTASIDEKISQVTKEIEAFKAINPPKELETDHRAELTALNIRLHALLQEKRASFVAYRDKVASASTSPSPDLMARINDNIRQLDKQLQDVLGEIRTNSVLAATTLPTDSRVGTAAPDVAVAVHNPVATDVLRAAPAPTPSPTPTPSSSPTSTSLAPTASGSLMPKNCSVVNLSPNDFSQFEKSFCGLVSDIIENKRRNPKAGIILARNEGNLQRVLFRTLVKSDGEYAIVLEAEEKRTDKQTGGGPGSAGTTTLAVKGGAPSAFGWAVENGAADADVSGTTITFRVNPIGAINALANNGYISSYREDENDAFTRFLRKTSIGVSFDANRAENLGTITGNGREISAFSARYEFVNERDPRHKKYQKTWEKFMATAGIDFTKGADKALNTLEDADDSKKFNDAALQKWYAETNAKLAEVESDVAEVQKVLNAQLDKMPVDKLSADTKNAITSFANALGSYRNAKEAILKDIASGNVITFEYTNNREINIPDTSNFRFIAETGTLGIDLTANASLTMYNKKPTGLNINRIRDFQFAGQFDVPLGNVTGIGQSVLSFAGKYQRLLNDNAIALDGTVLPGLKGDIAVGQLKLTVPIKGTGLRIPFSVTFANRTELVRENEVRGNFGFTFDLDTLLNRFKPF